MSKSISTTTSQSVNESEKTNDNTTSIKHNTKSSEEHIRNDKRYEEPFEDDGSYADDDCD